MIHEPHRRLAAVMFTDVVGYTAIMQGDEESARVVRLRHREALEAAVADHGGEVVQYLGDGSLSTFPSSVGAVSAAVEIQAALAKQVPLRIGIHQGEIAYDEQGIYGDSVNVSARVMSLATGGSVLISDKTNDELKNQRTIATASLGHFELRNVAAPTRVYAIDAPGLTVPSRELVLEAMPAERRVSELPWGLVVSGVVLAVALITDLVFDLSQGLSLESYVIAWAGSVAGIWFLFDKTEASLSNESRARVATWIRSTDFAGSVRFLPSMFVLAFDRFFGERHLSWQCFYRSCFVSLVTVSVGFSLWFAFDPVASRLLLSWQSAFNLAWIVVLSGLFNFLPDYLSLLETRYAIRWMERSGHVLAILLLDLVFTSVISAGLIFLAVEWIYDSPFPVGPIVPAVVDLVTISDYFGGIGLSLNWQSDRAAGLIAMPLGVFFYSAFITSIWIWLYILAWVLAKGALALGGGVGFMLDATDVDSRPFRSMGYVMVLGITIVFLALLPLVL